MSQTDNESTQKVKLVWKTKNGVRILNPHKKFFGPLIKSIATLFSPGDYFYFTFDFTTLQMTFVSDEIKDVLGIEPFEYNLDYVFKNMDPHYLEEYHKIENAGFNFLINFLPTEDIRKYKVCYLIKIKSGDGTYKTLLHQSKAITISKDGKVQEIFCIQTDLSSYDIKMDYSISFISETRPSYYLVNTDPPYCYEKITHSLTEREIRIVKELAKGNTNKEIADILDISPHTVKTHKKNILKKTKCYNTPDLVARSIREGLIT
ncbi:helix-turn-helix transcriptional regulator [Salinimicrobium sp. HB62]|uniref:helix-turn-helix transcriptional regulator n=1 Tax=Salinimicrobium sp. HB62 TaxID=3077781 RepID=UPI002D79EE36|nr:response regulator transcription factor [Salinimicrobium sp. HB62]